MNAITTTYGKTSFLMPFNTHAVPCVTTYTKESVKDTIGGEISTYTVTSITAYSGAKSINVMGVLSASEMCAVYRRVQAYAEMALV